MGYSTNLNNNRPVIIWLLSGAFLVFLMVIIGGITRLTGSGLSITEWKVIMGAIPPLNENEWMEAFEKYKQIPQFQLLNRHFNLEDFKQIFFWEWFHRLLGRIIGIVFIVPFFYFLWKKKFDKTLIKKLIFVFLLGGFQGFLGWYMVKSGLSELTSVSHYRLAIHLITAFTTFGFIFWIALDLTEHRNINVNPKLNNLFNYTRIVFAVLILQIIYGAFVAGLDAGFIYNTWPKMNNEWIASNAFSLDPFWINFTEHKDGIQLVHRMLAYILSVLALILFYKGKSIVKTPKTKNALILILITLSIQLLLGIFTLLYAVPLTLGVLHQAGAFLLFGSFIYLLHRIKCEI